MMKWIKDNLSGINNQAIAGTNYTEDWLAGMLCQGKQGFLFLKHANQGKSFAEICPLMKEILDKEKQMRKNFPGFGFCR
jgi:hypothetical protein